MAEYIEREAVKRLANKKFVSTFCSCGAKKDGGFDDETS